MKNSEQLDKAANELLGMVERDLAKLSPVERAARRKAFHEVVARVEKRAKCEGRSTSAENLPRIRKRA